MLNSFTALIQSWGALITLTKVFGINAVSKATAAKQWGFFGYVSNVLKTFEPPLQSLILRSGHGSFKHNKSAFSCLFESI